jgi:hypothetical protein
VKMSDLDGWIPSRIRWRDADPVVEWIWLGERRFTEPFFSETLDSALRDPFTLLFRHETPIATLGERREIRPGLKPTGFIFHTSRCGSTLISQLLSSAPGAVVISEAPPIDSLLRGGPKLTEEQRSVWVEWLIGALGQPRSGNETRYFIKLDCWHAAYLPILRRALPDVPWIFLYRDPVEVLASHQIIPALWSAPGMLDPGLIGADLPEVIQMGRLEYCARVIEKVCESALSFQEDMPGKFVNYSELPEAVWTTVASHFGVTFAAPEIAAMQAKSSFNAKTPGLYFRSDSDAKRREASAQVAGLAERRLYPVYERLEQKRKSLLRDRIGAFGI